jgi:hypothetical protein
MKANLHFSIPLTVFIVIGLLVSGCAQPDASPFRITDPHNGNTFPLHQTVNVKIELNGRFADYRGEHWLWYEWIMTDDGRVIASGSGDTQTRGLNYGVVSLYTGPHYIVVKGRGARVDTERVETNQSIYRNVYRYSDWVYTNEVCFFTGPNPPEDFCSVRTSVQPLTVATLTPTFMPTATPVTPVPIRPNPHNPGGTNPSGCAAQNSQTRCNLAGCSWNPQNSSCSVNP